MTFTDPNMLLGLLALPVVILLHWLALGRGERRLALLAGSRSPNPLLVQWRPGDRRLAPCSGCWPSGS